MSNTKFEKSVISAITAFEKGSDKLVRLFETAIDGYHTDGNEHNVAFILTALKNHKVIQKAAVSIAKRFVSGDVLLKDGTVTITLKKWKEGKKEATIAKFAEFKARALVSFLHDNKIESQLTFALDKRLKGVESSLTKFIVDAVANGEDVVEVRRQLADLINRVSRADLTDKISEAREKLASAAPASNDAAPVEETAAETNAA